SNQYHPVSPEGTAGTIRPQALPSLRDSRACASRYVEVEDVGHFDMCGAKCSLNVRTKVDLLGRSLSKAVVCFEVAYVCVR
ncbi:MAG: hypothetical protein ABJZ55_20295, partial [Fuerstiella sp.]